MVRMELMDHYALGSVAESPELPGEVRYLARQPIMDLRGRVHGYELLYRAGPETCFRGDGNIATRTMLDNTILFGLERLAGGLPAFVNCTQEALVEKMVQVLPARVAVLEILENIEPTPELVAACRQLHAEGYRFALDDFTWKQNFDPLVELADYIKVDFVQCGPEQRQSLLKRLRGAKGSLVAEKIETQEEYKQACKEGFSFFQGYYFCRPTLLENRNIPGNRLSHIEIMQHLRSDELDIPKLTLLLKRNTSLTYRLLRLVNSPLCAMRQEIRSIKAALIVVGEDTFRHLAMLAIATELNGNQPPEILRMAFVRARFCELAAGLCLQNSSEQFLLGMLSLLPAMLRLPMDKLTPALPLRKEVREALLGQANSERAMLQWLESYECGQWSACSAVALAEGIDEKELVSRYTAAIEWAEKALGAAAGPAHVAASSSLRS